MKPAEEHGIEGTQLSELEVDPIFVVPTVALEVIVEVGSSYQSQGMLAIVEGVGIGSTSL